MRIALAQLNYMIGDFEGNFGRMAERVEEAREAGADLILFSELAVCGYPPRDFLEFRDFIRRCDEVVQKLSEMEAQEEGHKVAQEKAKKEAR